MKKVKGQRLKAKGRIVFFNVYPITKGYSYHINTFLIDDYKLAS